jgi:hypothetical protein
MLQQQGALKFSVELIFTKDFFEVHNVSKNIGAISNSTRHKSDIKFYTDGPQIFGTTINNLNAQATWQLKFMHPCPGLNKSTVHERYKADSMGV